MILADYACDSCGDVHERMVESPAPDEMPCEFCDAVARWSPTPVMGKVRAYEVQRGKYEKPDQKTYLDTRELGEGMPIEEFRAKRRKIWEEKRWRETKEML